MNVRNLADRSAVDPRSLSLFDGFPYLLTRVAPAFYHVILLPAEHDADILLSLGHRQTQANRLPACVVLKADLCAYIVDPGKAKPSRDVPQGGILVTGKLAPCENFPETPELAERRRRLEAFLQARASSGCAFGDVRKGGRPATPEDLIRLTGPQVNGVPTGLVRCPSCHGWKGECLDPNPSLPGLVVEVHCRCENDNCCARCGELLYDWRLGANHYDPRDGQVWHAPGFCAFRHQCNSGTRSERTAPHVH